MADEGNHRNEQGANGDPPLDSKEALGIDVAADTSAGTAEEDKFCPAIEEASAVASAEGDGTTVQVAVLPFVPVDSSNAELVITEEPRQRGFRFRYSCEGPSHGGLPGDTSEKNRKTYPTVQLKGYEGHAARVVVSLVTQDDPPRPHAHSLVGRHVVNGQCTVQVGPDTNWMATFPNLGILHVTKKNVVKVLLERYALALTGPGATTIALPIMPDLKPGAGPQTTPPDEAAVIAGAFKKLTEKEHSQLKSMAEEASRHMNLSVVRLCFQAYLADANGNFTKPLAPCISQPVYDSKAPSASTLKICRMDRHSGSVLGGDEVYTLVDRVQKDDIEVRFFTETENAPGSGSDDGSGSKTETWSALANFAPSDVHRQFAIVLKTPPYCDTNITRPVNVWVQLRRRSDNETSDAKPFTYQPQVVDTEQLARKRLKKIPHFIDHYGEASNNRRGNDNGGGGGGGGGAAGGGSGDPMWGSTGGGAGGGAANGGGAPCGGSYPSTGAGFGFNGLPPLSGRQATTAGGSESSADGVSGDPAERVAADEEPAGHHKSKASRRLAERRERTRSDRHDDQESRKSHQRRRGTTGRKHPRPPLSLQKSGESSYSSGRQRRAAVVTKRRPRQSAKRCVAACRVPRASDPSRQPQRLKGALRRHHALHPHSPGRRGLRASCPVPRRRVHSP